MKTLLVDTFLFVPQLVEDAGSGRLIARGEFARANVPTANKRVYRPEIWEKSLRIAREQMDRNSLYGEVDHPSDGKTSLKRISHLIKDLKFDGNIVYGEAEILDTPNGKILQKIAESGAAIGISSRGLGSISRDNQGNEIVQEDYEFITFDFVADPANATSWPKFERNNGGGRYRGQGTHEEKKETQELLFINETEEEKMQIKDLGELKEKFPKIHEQLVESVKSGMKDSLKNEVMDILKNERDEIKQRVESKLLSDPNVAGSKTVLESIVKQLRPYLLKEDAEGLVRDREEEIENLRASLGEQRSNIKNMEDAVDKMTDVAKTLGLQLYFEKTVSSLTDKDVVESLRARIGDPGEYSSINLLKESMKSNLTALMEEVRGKEKMEEDMNRRIAKEQHARDIREKELLKLRKKNTELKEAAKKSVRLASKLAMRAYVSESVSGDPRARKILKIMENENITTQEEADERIDELKAQMPISERYRSVRDGLVRKRGTQDQRKSLHEEQEQNVMGVSLNELKQLSGL